MWDMQTGSSRGYGFVSFTSQDDAQNAMDSMQGQDLNGRPLRINWAAKRDNNNNNNYQQRRNYGNNNRGGFRQYNRKLLGLQ
ncbi:AKR_collapsed_G0047190.mRNA.1.CDS.1 [Saccharomyces cerevisiae]|nr:AKR_collapsed_G0047190.mRNA.1.CDS.1 [Saccharomyces cerevisiae]